MFSINTEATTALQSQWRRCIRERVRLAARQRCKTASSSPCNVPLAPAIVADSTKTLCASGQDMHTCKLN